MSIALALPPDGTVVACDISSEFADIGKPYWKEAEVSEKIDLRIAPATETLRTNTKHTIIRNSQYIGYLRGLNFQFNVTSQPFS